MQTKKITAMSIDENLIPILRAMGRQREMKLSTTINKILKDKIKSTYGSIQNAMKELENE